MARMYNFGFMEFDHMLDKLEHIPEPTKNSMMRAAGEEYKKHTEKTAATMGVEGYTNTRTGKSGGGGKYSRGSGGIRSKLVLKKQGKALYVTWNRTTAHRKGVTEADIAFLTEYGVPGRGIPARPFIAQAVEEGLLDAYEAALDELEKIL